MKNASTNLKKIINTKYKDTRFGICLNDAIFKIYFNSKSLTWTSYPLFNWSADLVASKWSQLRKNKLLGG